MSAEIIASARSLLSAAGSAGVHVGARKPGNQQLVTRLITIWLHMSNCELTRLLLVSIQAAHHSPSPNSRSPAAASADSRSKISISREAASTSSAAREVGRDFRHRHADRLARVQRSLDGERASRRTQQRSCSERFRTVRPGVGHCPEAARDEAGRRKVRQPRHSFHRQRVCGFLHHTLRSSELARWKKGCLQYRSRVRLSLWNAPYGCAFLRRRLREERQRHRRGLVSPQTPSQVVEFPSRGQRNHWSAGRHAEHDHLQLAFRRQRPFFWVSAYCPLPQ